MQQAGEDSNVAFVRDWGKLLGKGLRDYKEGRFQEAIDMFSELLKNANLEVQWYYRALYYRSNLYTLTKQYQKALSDINKYNEYYLQSTYGLFAKAMIYLQLGDQDQAMAVFLDMAKLDPKFVLSLREATNKFLEEKQIANKEEVKIQENTRTDTDS